MMAVEMVVGGHAAIPEDLPHVIEISTNTYFTHDDYVPLDRWLESDEAHGRAGYFYRDRSAVTREGLKVRYCETFVAFDHMPTAFAFKMRFG